MATLPPENALDTVEPQTTRQTYFSKNTKDTGTAYIITSEIPGFEKEEISISVVGNNLHLDAKNKDRNKTIDYVLPLDADKEGIGASLKNGIITITIQKKTAAKAVKIEIK